MVKASPFWTPETFGRKLPLLQTRNDIKAAVRRLFAEFNFIEVDLPILQLSPGNETHISAFETELVDQAGQAHRAYLHTSPELTCKKLLSAGLSRFFTFAPVFRNRERGRLHAPEFTMLEWYRAREPLDALIGDIGRLLRTVAAAARTERFRHRGAESDPNAEPDRVTVCEAFRRFADLDLISMLPDKPEAFERLADETRRRGLRVAADDNWSDLFSKLLSLIEPRLGRGRPTILCRYPVSEAALATICNDDARFAERFELYVCGVEVANAFAELTDAAEQRRRFEHAEDERERIYGQRYPLDEDFLAALDIMPPSCGIALGFDRLVMLATGAATVDAVAWAPVLPHLAAL